MTQDQKESLQYLIRCFVVGDEEQEQFDWMFRDEKMFTIGDIKNEFGIDGESSQIVYARFLCFREDNYENDYILDKEMTIHLSEKYFGKSDSEVEQEWDRLNDE